MSSRSISESLKTLLYILLTALMISAVSCGKSESQPDKYSFYENTVDSGKPLAWGNDRDIYVFCDEPNWKLNEDMLRRSLERDTYIVVNERYFNIIRGGSYFKPESSWWYIQGGPQPLTKTQMQLLVSPGYDRSATVGFRCVMDR